MPCGLSQMLVGSPQEAQKVGGCTIGVLPAVPNRHALPATPLSQFSSRHAETPEAASRACSSMACPGARTHGSAHVALTPPAGNHPARLHSRLAGRSL